MKMGNCVKNTRLISAGDIPGRPGYVRPKKRNQRRYEKDSGTKTDAGNAGPFPRSGKPVPANPAPQWLRRFH